MKSALGPSQVFPPWRADSSFDPRKRGKNVRAQKKKMCRAENWLCVFVWYKNQVFDFKLQISHHANILPKRAMLSVRHLTSGNNKHSCQAADYLLPSTFNTQQLHCCEQITDHFKVMTAAWTVIISSDRLSPVGSLHILHKGCCGEADISL